ncbi:TRAP transporter small permease [Urechidicola croceus]|uniref:C4-dicarboxylate ABC transporter permease n=1 Tax=Urechidicola croceus TaxID=1850246 RepID=A0A1D8P7M2_9FLAO|nr:TRAP transporter small permease [Urechidicola croceus]AOW20574.1 C4-dicarboxylate ABC transporter permease [Urechidicola croceus]
MKSKLDNFLGWILAILLGAMVLDVLWGVFSRYALGFQSSWTDELARFLLIWVGILGSAYASGKNMHIAIDLLPQYLNEKNKKRLDIFNTVIISLFVLGVFIIGGLRYVYISFALGQTSAALKLPMGIVYAVFPIAGILIIYYRIRNTFFN